MRRAFGSAKLRWLVLRSARDCAVVLILTRGLVPFPAAYAQQEPGAAGRESRSAVSQTGSGPNASGCEERLTLASDTLFEFESADLGLEAELSLQVAGAILQQKAQNHTVLIEGHTDSLGPDSVNDRLSERRAQMVRDWFIERGFLKPGQVTVKGYGKRRPVAPNTKPDGSDNPEGRRQNRRVDIVVNVCD